MLEALGVRHQSEADIVDKKDVVAMMMVSVSKGASAKHAEGPLVSLGGGFLPVFALGDPGCWHQVER